MAAGEPTVHDQIAQGLKEHPAKKGMRFNILVTAVEVGGSIALFHLAQRMGASDVVSYLIGSIAPVLGGFMVWAKARKFSGASAAIFSFTALSAVDRADRKSRSQGAALQGLRGHGPDRLDLLGLLRPGPQAGRVLHGPALRADGTHDGMAIFDRMWDSYRDFRTGMYVISYLWAALFLIQAAGTALIIRETRYSTAYNYDQTLPLAATALGIVGSIAIGRYFAKKGKARGVTASVVPPAD